MQTMSVRDTFFQGLFAINFLNTLIVLYVITKIIHNVPFLGSKRKRHEYSIFWSALCFKYLMLKMSPWIRIHGLNELMEAWKQMAKEKYAPFMISNHNSKLDSLMLTGLLPTWLGPRMRAMIKLALFDEWLFGWICKAVGHFPVYFKGSQSGDFSVDKQQQQRVANEMDAFLRDDGGLLVFAEGQLNKTPRKIQTLRRGSFTLPIQLKRPIWAFINVGCEQVWPYGCMMGGKPGNIYVRAFKIVDNAADYDNVELANLAGLALQNNVDQLYKLADAKAN